MSRKKPDSSSNYHRNGPVTDIVPLRTSWSRGTQSTLHLVLLTVFQDPPRMSQLCLLCSTTFLVYSSKVCHIPPKSNMVRFFTARACFLVSTSILIACLSLCLKYHNESSLHRASLFWFILLEAEESIMVRRISVSSRHGSRNRSGVISSFFGTKSQGDQTRNRENTYS